MKPTPFETQYRRKCEDRILGMRTTRYSWWNHARELADYLLPRRYKWIVTPNQMSRGAQINQHILDSTGTLAARNLASGMMSGMSSPTNPWFRLSIKGVDLTKTTPETLWLALCEKILRDIFQESNFYNSVAMWYFDLVIFGTASMLMYDDFDNVICCFNPCFGEFYVDNDDKMRPVVFAREFTLTVKQCSEQFGLENCSEDVQGLVRQGGAALTRELVIAHLIEPNTGPDREGFPDHFDFREAYWEWGGTAAPQSRPGDGFLQKKGYMESPSIISRWDLVSNDPYGRSPAMDALPDVKQLQQETRRKGQGIDKGVNPPMVADVQLKNQPASLLPGGTTYVSGMMQTGNAGFAPVYGSWKPAVKEMTEDITQVQERIKKIFFNDVLQTISQYETRSNVTAVEIDARKAESLVMLGPVLGRVTHEGLTNFIERAFAIGARAGVFPPPPASIAGAPIDINFISMLSIAQEAAAAAGIERILSAGGELAGVVGPSAMDKIDTDFSLDKLSSLLNNDPRLMRSDEEVAQMRQQRQQQEQQQAASEQAEKLAKGAKNLSETPIGQSSNALEQILG